MPNTVRDTDHCPGTSGNTWCAPCGLAKYQWAAEGRQCSVLLFILTKIYIRNKITVCQILKVTQIMVKEIKSLTLLMTNELSL